MKFLKRIKPYFIENFKYYLTICCTSFTVVILILSVINICFDLMSSNMWINNIELFGVCFLITMLMLFTDMFTKNSNIFLVILVHLIDTFIPVFGIGGFLFSWFPISWYWIGIISSILIVIYFSVHGIMLLHIKSTSDGINKKILERKGEHKNDKENH